MNNSFDNNSLLYYPTIEVNNPSWFKSALTIWDKVYRIVPNSYSPKDNDEIREAVNAGVLININLNEADLEDTAEEYMSFIDSLEVEPAGFSSSQYEARLHAEKIDDRLKKFFKSQSHHFDNDGFYHLPAEIANGYMFFLAKSIADRRGIPKLTDNPDMFAAMSYFDAQGKFDELITTTEGEEMYTIMTIETLIPADIPYISIDKILQRSENMKNMKREFRSIIAKFMDEIKDIKDPDFAKEKVRELRSTLQEKSYTWTELMKQVSDNLVPACLVAGFPAAIAAGLAMIAGTAPIAIGGVASAVYFVSAGAMIKSVDKVSSVWNSSKSNYYMQVRKDSISNRESNITNPNWYRLLEEFVND